MQKHNNEVAQTIRWFTTVIHHAALRSKRKHRRWEREALILNQSGINDMELVDQITNLDSMKQYMTKEEWMSVFETLPSRERKVIYNLYLRDLTQQQTAQVLGISQQQVSRLHRKAIQCLHHEMVKR